jgi:phasin family protein
MTQSSKKNAESAASVAAGTTAMMTAQTEQAITMAKASFDQIAARSREAMEQSMKTVNVVTEMTRGNVDALLESSRVASGAFQEIAKDVVAYSNQSLERTASAVRTMSHAKTAPELMKLQSEFARAEFSTAISEVTKLSQLMFQTMTAIFEPLQKQAITAAQIKDLLGD